MKTILSLLVFSMLHLTIAMAGPEDLNLSDQGLALQGYDAVSYFDNQPLKGAAEFQLKHQGVTYRFASAANKSRFEADPQQFIPAYGGWCAWAMLDGKKVQVNPERYKIVDGVNYLFYDGFWGNTLEKWNDKAAQQGEATLVKNADDHWTRLISD